VWAHGAGRRQIVRDVPGDGGTVRFRFPCGEPAYRELVGAPGLSATVVVDRATGHILGVRFRNLSRP
jgi:hypothetical protein